MVEVIVALGLFGILMTITTAAMMNGLRTVQEMTARQALQREEQNAAEWISGQLRFIDNPYQAVPSAPAVTFAGFVNGKPTMTFTTFAGLGTVDRVPYQVTLTQGPDAIETTVFTPDMSTGLPIYSSTRSVKRALVRSTTSQSPTLTLRYFSDVGPSAPELVPPPNGSLTTAQMSQIKQVQFTIIGDPDSQAVSQTVVLGNPI